MNRVIIAAVLIFSTSLAPAQYLRRFGTNLYDFSAVLSSTNRSYLVEGVVTSAGPSGVELRRESTQLWLIPDERFLPPGPSGMLGYAVAAKIGAQPISAGQYLALSPAFQAMVHQKTEVWRGRILNYTAPCTAGSQIRVVALSLGRADKTGAELWDCGLPPGDLNQYTFVFRVLPKGILKAPFTPPARHADKPKEPEQP